MVVLICDRTQCSETLQPLKGIADGAKICAAFDIPDAFAPAQLGDAVFTAQSIQHNANFLLHTVLLTRVALDVLNNSI